MYLSNDLRLQDFLITKNSDGFFLEKRDNSVSFQTSSLAATPQVFAIVTFLASRGWHFNQTNISTYRFDKDGLNCIVENLDRSDLWALKLGQVEITGPLTAITLYLLEITNGVYDCDFKGKVVLDVGGFCGETAVFFAAQGAKKVVIYEPVLENHKFIKDNLIRNHVNAEVHDQGIGEKTGIKKMRYDIIDPSFGLTHNGSKELEIKVTSVTDVIEASGADIAKFDCEGGETSLLNLPESTLRQIGFYMIETHSVKIKNEITKKFTKAGFVQKRPPTILNEKTSVLYFEK
jgi:FkbM family methyltransferase